MIQNMKDFLFCASKRRSNIKIMNKFFGNFFLAAMLALLAFAPVARASVTSVTAVPTQVSVSPTGGTLNVTWRVVHFVTGGGPITTSSTSYTILIDGTPVKTVSKLLSRTTSPTSFAPETLTFSEAIPISVTIASDIAKAGNIATIERTFDDTEMYATGTARLIVAGASGELAINRIELSFNNGAKTKVVGQNSDLRAVAELTFQAKGLLQAEWRLIGSGSRSSRLSRRLSIVRRQLSSSGNGTVRLVSPPLPTGISGLQEVGLFITDPDLSFDEPVLRYYVNPTATSSLSQMIPLKALRPQKGVPLNRETLFDWHPVEGAAAYQVELFDVDNAPASPANMNTSSLIVDPFDTRETLVAGKIVPGNQTSLSLSNFSIQHVTHGRIYMWRIRAIGQDGTVIGQSTLQEIVYP